MKASFLKLFPFYLIKTKRASVVFIEIYQRRIALNLLYFNTNSIVKSANSFMFDGIVNNLMALKRLAIYVMLPFLEVSSAQKILDYELPFCRWNVSRSG